MDFLKFFASIFVAKIFFIANLACMQPEHLYYSGYPYNSMSPKNEKHPFYFYDINPEDFDLNNTESKKLFNKRFNNNLKLTIITACCLREMHATRSQEILAYDKYQSGMRIVFEQDYQKLFLLGPIDIDLKNYIYNLISIIEKMNDVNLDIFSHGDLIRHKKEIGQISIPNLRSTIDMSPWEIKTKYNLTTKKEKIVLLQGFEKIKYTNIYSQFKICVSNMRIMLELIDKFVDNKIKKIEKYLKPYEGKKKVEIGEYDWYNIIDTNKQRKAMRDELKPTIAKTIEQIKAIEQGIRTGTPPSNPGTPASPQSPKGTED